jgi:hypothetical protein
MYNEYIDWAEEEYAEYQEYYPVDEYVVVEEEYLQIDEVVYLYEAGLGRQFDPEGLNYWIDEYETGVSLISISESFLVSDEFVLNFGNPYEMADTAFVEVLYENVLGRASDADGFAYWVEELDSGRLTEAEVLNCFAQSPENIAQATYVINLHENQYGYWDLA